jgi:hypothetical protein
MFPSLGSGGPPAEPVKKEEVPVPKQEVKPEEKAWWEKINNKQKIEIDEEEGPKVRNRKGKKEKWVTVKGIFN